MKILILSAKDDNGGIGYAIKRAFDRHAPEHEVRSVTRQAHPFGFPSDVTLNAASRSYVVDLFKSAEVIHIMDVFEAAERFPDYASKPRIFHHHGYDFKLNPQALMERCRREGIPQFVATHDLLRYGDDLTWLPNPCDIDHMQGIRAAWKIRLSESPLRVVQTPGGFEKNGTNEFLDGMRLLRPGTAFADVISGLPWMKAMQRKAEGDVMFDSFDVGYGISTLEGWGMRMPVVHGGDPKTEQAVLDTIGYTPYYHVTRDNFPERMQALVDDPALRTEYRDKGWQAVNDLHSEQAVVKNLTSIYEGVLS